MPEIRRRRNLSPPLAPWVGALVLVALLIVGGLWLARRETGVDPERFVTDSDRAGQLGMDPGGLGEPVVPPPTSWVLGDQDRIIPPPGEQDAWLRQLAMRLSRHPEWARFLVSDALMERFVGTVVDLAGDFYPGEHLPEVRPETPMTSVELAGRRVIDPESYRRFNTIVAVFQSLDTEGTVRLYQMLLPLMEDTYGELGLPGSFEVPLGLAARNLLAVEFPTVPPAVVGDEGVYVYEDRSWEEARGATKALLRMGPDHGRRIQEKIRELAAALDIEIPPVGPRP